MKLDDSLSQVTFSYDNNLDDGVDAITFGPFPYTGTITDRQRSSFHVTAYAAGAVSGILDHWSFTDPTAGAPGDFNKDGTLDVVDIDRLSAEVRSGDHDGVFDLNADDLVDELDRAVWVERLRKTYFGDSNLDGQFNSTDLVLVFQAAQYEDAELGNSTWTTGDWNGDAEFTSRDLVLAFQGGGFEKGPRPSHAVPEPGGMTIGLLSLTLLVRLRTRVR
jgi:hypothetical protein